MVSYDSRVCFAGRTSLTVYVRVSNSKTKEFIVDGFFTYVYTDDDGKPKPHGIVIEPKTDAEKELYDEAHELLEESKRDAGKQKLRRQGR